MYVAESQNFDNHKQLMFSKLAYYSLVIHTLAFIASSIDMVSINNFTQKFYMNIFNPKKSIYGNAKILQLKNKFYNANKIYYLVLNS